MSINFTPKTSHSYLSNKRDTLCFPDRMSWVNDDVMFFCCGTIWLQKVALLSLFTVGLGITQCFSMSLDLGEMEGWVSKCNLRLKDLWSKLQHLFFCWKWVETAQTSSSMSRTTMKTRPRFVKKTMVFCRKGGWCLRATVALCLHWCDLSGSSSHLCDAFQSSSPKDTRDLAMPRF